MFYCYLGDDYLNFYLSTGRKDYLFTSLHILNIMRSGVLYNDFLLNSIIDHITLLYTPYSLGGKRIIIAKDMHDFCHRTQKFFWTFLCRYFDEAL